ncbi:MAG: hypothetical protein IJS58_08640 [Bacilli bacterium]|nr:hypothetical protein [Bacilli bacterium]
MREFNHNSTWDSVEDMTINEAINILSHDANSNDKDWSARPHKAKAAQMAIEALNFYQNYLSSVATSGNETNAYLAKNRYLLYLKDINDEYPLGQMYYKHIPHKGEVFQFYINDAEHYYVYTLRTHAIINVYSAIFRADIEVKVEDVIELQKEDFLWEV